MHMRGLVPRILKHGLALALIASLALAALATSWLPTDRDVSEDEWLQCALSNGVWIGRVRIVDARHVATDDPGPEPYVEAEPIQWLVGGCPERRIVLYAMPTDQGGLGDIAGWSPEQRSSVFVMVSERRNHRLYIGHGPHSFRGGYFPLQDAERPEIEARVRRAVESLELESLARRASCILVGSCRGVVRRPGGDRPWRGYSIAMERLIAGDPGPGPLVVFDPIGWQPDSTRRLLFLGRSADGRLERIGFALGHAPIVGGRLPVFAGITLEEAATRIRRAREVAGPR